MLYQEKMISERIHATGVSDRVDTVDKSYSLARLMTLKGRLNAAKTKLDPIYAKGDPALRRFLFMIDTYSGLKKQVRAIANAQIVTNAWSKYWELIKYYKLVADTQRFKVFFNAELPGAALVAMNHYMRTERPKSVFEWRASSLMPSKDNKVESLEDVYGLYANNRENWMMTTTNDGDMTSLSNVRDIAKRIRDEFGEVDFVSHDAGINASENYNEQEAMNAQLDLGCMLADLAVLRTGGNMIAKQYTFFETFTWNMILIWADLFDEFYISKPLTSRPSNSEIYLVGKGYRGMSDKLRHALEERMENFDMKPILSEDACKAHPAAIAELYAASEAIFGQQARFIENNVVLYNKYHSALDTLNKMVSRNTRAHIDQWLRDYKIKSIDKRDWLPMRVAK